MYHRQGNELLSACWPALTIQGYFFPAHKEWDNLKVTQTMVPALSLITLMQLYLNAHELPGIALHPHPRNLAQSHSQDWWLQQDWRHYLSGNLAARVQRPHKTRYCLSFSICHYAGFQCLLIGLHTHTTSACECKRQHSEGLHWSNSVNLVSHLEIPLRELDKYWNTTLSLCLCCRW